MCLRDFSTWHSRKVSILLIFNMAACPDDLVGCAGRLSCGGIHA